MSTATMNPPVRVMKKFQLLRGIDIQHDPSKDEYKIDPKTNEKYVHKKGDRTYRPGDVIDTDLDLDKMFNVDGYEPKYRRLDEAEGVKRMPGESPVDHKTRLEELLRNQKAVYAQYFADMKLDDKGLGELKAFAAAEKFDLGKLKPTDQNSRDAILKYLKSEVEKLTK